MKKMSSKTMLIVLGRLPLLFVVDSILRGTFLDFSFGSYDETSMKPIFTPKTESSSVDDFLYNILWNLLLLLVSGIAVVLVCTPISYIMDFYRWIAGAVLVWFSYGCNQRYIQGVLDSVSDDPEESHSVANMTDIDVNQPLTMPLSVNLLIQSFIALAFDQVSVSRILPKSRSWFVHSRYPLSIFISLTFSFPIFFESFFAHKSTYAMSFRTSVILSLFALAIHFCFVVYTVTREVIVPGIIRMTLEMRDNGLDGLIMNIMEKANFSLLLRLFFVTQVVYRIVSSKVFQDSNDSPDSWVNMVVWKILVQDILYNMCGTLISVMSLASIVTVISGWSLFCVYKIIQAYDEEESLQPAVSGFLFVLLAMQTGITAITGDLRLQLLFQNSILLVVANQHFVHSVATDLLLKASTDDTAFQKHIRPLIPFVFFFTFPFFAVMPLWSYPFRVSWLLAVTVFCIELIIKSISTIIIYIVNMLHTHTNVIFSEDTDNTTFYIKGVCGCLEFICGIFLFLNGAYIFIYESGGFIRLFMMTIHFYCNIYQSAIKGWGTYKLRLSSWEKVNNLESAKQEQLDENGVCSICYQEMNDAVALDCDHIFHKSCLQKWLSIKETCPLCHAELKNQPDPDSEVPVR